MFNVSIEFWSHIVFTHGVILYTGLNQPSSLDYPEISYYWYWNPGIFWSNMCIYTLCSLHGILYHILLNFFTSWCYSHPVQSLFRCAMLTLIITLVLEGLGILLLSSTVTLGATVITHSIGGSKQDLLQHCIILIHLPQLGIITLPYIHNVCLSHYSSCMCVVRGYTCIRMWPHMYLSWGSTLRGLVYNFLWPSVMT